jgi:hypothetical protein
VREVIIGIESYLNWAIFSELGSRDKLTPEIKEYLKNPFSIKGKGGTAEKYYIQLPSLFCDEITLDKYNPELWKSVKKFYDEIRNPIFHGSEFHSPDFEKLNELFDFLAKIYKWIDSWCDLDKVLPGAGWLCKFDEL